MTEYFYCANSKADPFFSDRSDGFISAETPIEALEKAMEAYQHPCGLYSINIYSDANAFHKGSDPLTQWLCDKGKKDWKK